MPALDRRPTTASRLSRAGLGLALAALLAVGTGVPATAVNASHGSGVVSEVPAATTPHVVDGSVQSFVQLGDKMVAAGTFTRVRQTPDGPDIVRNGIFAFDAKTGTIDPTFDPNLGGTANSLDTDGTFIYVGGSFGSVGGVTTTRRLAKLTAAGALVKGLKVPNSGVNEVVVRGNRLFVGGQFTSVGGTPRGGFAVLDTGTGALLPEVDVPFTGTYNGGSTAITRMDVDPAGTQVVAVGNFISVAGQPREQIAIVDTPAGAPATVSTWSTERLSKARNPKCSLNFETWTRDVDISPDGSYFVVTTTGAFGGGGNTGAMCDTNSRWETGRTGGAQEPTWVAYTGGDTSYGVAITGSAVYVGGHMRWQNNPFQGDQAGPGAVSREGVVALDPLNGVPLTWNPGRTRGVGAQAMYATPDGLWVGSDTDRFNGRLRMRIAYLPLAGGTSVAPVRNPVLPNAVFSATRATTTSSGVLYRTNAAGPALQSGDAGPGWTTDSGRVSGGSGSTFTAIPTTDATVPASTPAQLFSTERWGAQKWSFPTTVGRALTVRLYFANNAASTALPGQRKFDVTLDGRLVLDDFDVVAETGGTRRGTVREFAITSDGTVNIDLSAVVNNPLINGIEIVDPSLVGATAPGVLQRRDVDPSGAATPAPVTVGTGMDFSTVRGATLAGGTLYYGLPDGGLYARSFDPRSGAVGPQRTINLNDDPEDGRRIPFPIAQVTGMAFDATSHRLYYTLFNDPKLYYRYFTPQSEIVGAQTFVASTPGLSFTSAAGLAIVDGQLLYGSTADASLRSVPFAGGATTGTPTVISTGTWGQRDLFVSPVPPNVPPTASFTVSCDQDGTCVTDGSASTDADGTLTAYSWTFGDGGTASGSTARHTYAADGTYDITLSVTDDSGATRSSTQAVQVKRVSNQLPTASFTATCVDLGCTFDGGASSDPDGTDLRYSWALGEGAATATGVRTSHSYSAAGSYTVTLTVTDARGGTATASRTVTAVAPVSSIGFRGATSVEGNLVTVALKLPEVEAGDAVVLSLTQNAARSVGSPTGAGSWTDHGTQTGNKDQIRTTTWSKVATADDAGATVSVTLSDRAKVVLTAVAYSGTDAVSPVASYTAAAETAVSATHTTPGALDAPSGAWVVSGWADMSSLTTDWTAPEGEAVRAETIGIGSGRVTALVSDRGPVPAGAQPGRTATADSASLKAITWTLVLRP